MLNAIIHYIIKKCRTIANAAFAAPFCLVKDEGGFGFFGTIVDDYAILLGLRGWSGFFASLEKYFAVLLK